MNIFQIIIYKLVCRYLRTDRDRAEGIIQSVFLGDERMIKKLLPEGTHIHSNPPKGVKKTRKEMV